MGYRFAVRIVEYPIKASAGDILHINLCIDNRGVAPIYHRYPLKLRLIGDKGSFEFETDADITSRLPGNHLWEGSIRLPENIPVGNYRLFAGIGDGKNEVLFANKTERVDRFSLIGEKIAIA